MLQPKAAFGMQNVFWLMVPEGETNITMGKAQQQDQKAERSHLHHASEAERMGSGI